MQQHTRYDVLPHLILLLPLIHKYTDVKKGYHINV